MWAALIWTIAGREYSEPVKTVEDNLTLLERQLPEGKRFFGGDTIGFLDIAVSGISLWLEVFEEVAGVPLLTEEKHPALCRWAREYTAEETVRRCLPERRHIITALTARKELYAVYGGLAKPAVSHAPK
jgi:glutathione S-transferase